MKRLITERGLAANPALLRKGQAVVWAANLLHGGAPITRPGATRRSLVTHYFFEGCSYFTPMLSDPDAGRMFRRLPVDVRTGRWRWPKPFWPGLAAVARAVRMRLQPGPVVLRDGS